MPSTAIKALNVASRKTMSTTSLFIACENVTGLTFWTLGVSFFRCKAIGRADFRGEVTPHGTQ